MQYSHRSGAPFIARAATYDNIVAAIAAFHAVPVERIEVRGERIFIDGILKANRRVVSNGRDWRYESNPPRN